MTVDLTPAQQDRAAGVLAVVACGDALGAPYEFGPPLEPDHPVGMIGGGTLRWAPGEWTDDTQMSVVILQAALAAADEGGTLVDRLDDVTRGWVDWARSATDVGIQTRTILHDTAAQGDPTAARTTATAVTFHERNGRSGGNGSLMRTAPVALAYLHDERALAAAAQQVSELTHTDVDAGDACVLWCAAIRHAVLEGECDVRVGLPLLPADRRDRWAGLIHDAEAHDPRHFDRNGWVVQAFQAAWSAISRTTATPADATGRVRLALEAAVRGGRDADTVAAIAGALLGARWGVSAVPADWIAVVHGWPDLTVWDLADRGLRLALAPTRST